MGGPSTLSASFSQLFNYQQTKLLAFAMNRLLFVLRDWSTSKFCDDDEAPAASPAHAPKLRHKVRESPSGPMSRVTDEPVLKSKGQRSGSQD